MNCMIVIMSGPSLLCNICVMFLWWNCCSWIVSCWVQGRWLWYMSHVYRAISWLQALYNALSDGWTVRNVIGLSGNKGHDSSSVSSAWLVVVLVVSAELRWALEELDWRKSWFSSGIGNSGGFENYGARSGISRFMEEDESWCEWRSEWYLLAFSKVWKILVCKADEGVK